MNYSQFLQMVPEATLVAILIILFFADFAYSKSEKKHPVLRCLTHTLLLLQLVPCVLAAPAEVFGGLYVSTAAANAMKLILTGGTLVVAIMAQTWIEHNEVTRRYEGEFYMLLVSTLLGMYVMTSSGHFMMFFLGLEMASVPMACLVAMDKWKKDSAEAGAKYILTATFSSAIMLYGISFIYGACGTLYFNDVAQALTVTPLTIAGLVFFFAGLGFKLSLVPFHFWTADTYQGAPTTVTAYLSVVSKGAAAFALCTILMKVFAPMTEQWEIMLDVVIVLSITIANLFAMRQTELKRFMAFSSISQAGYIMLAVIGNSSMGLASLMFYTLVYVAANLAVFAVISVVEQNNGGTTERSSLAGFYETNPRLSFVLRLHGRCPAGLVLGLLRGVHRPDQHRAQPLLLSAHREGDVHQEDYYAAAHLPERLCHQAGPCHLHRWHRPLWRLVCHLRMAQRRGCRLSVWQLTLIIE